MGIPDAAHALRIPYGADDGFLLPEAERFASARQVQGADVRTVHCPTVYRSYLRDNRPYLGRRRLNSDGGHLQLAVYSLAAEYPLFPDIHGFRRIILRRI